MLAATASQALAAPRQQRLLARRAARPQRLVAVPRCAAGGSSGSIRDAPLGPLPSLARSLTAAAAALLLAGMPAVLPPPAAAELSTITAQQATEMAKPLKQQKVNKGRIWALFVLGATALFGTTVVLENNEKWFPAISRANRAMKAAQQRAAAAEKASAEEQAAFEARLAEVQQERAVDAAVDAAVLEGLAAARQRSSEPASSSDTTSNADAAVAAAAVTQEAAPAPAATAAEAAAAPPAAAEEPPAASHEEAPATPHASSSEAAAPAATPAAAGSGSDDSSAPAEGEEAPRKPLFEISAEQIEASSAKRMEQLQAELDRRKTTTAGAPPEA
ncbi:hypothetical protein ABPG77_004595 [Micractinium sp. CCAP 211/92]